MCTRTPLTTKLYWEEGVVVSTHYPSTYVSEGSQRLGCQRSQLQTPKIPPYGAFRQYAEQWTTLLIPQSQSKTSLSVFTQMKGASKSNKSSNSTTPD